MKRLYENTLMNLTIFFVPLLLITGLLSVAAEERFLTADCTADFPESMLHLQELIKSKGYTISRVQHVDKGLRSRGYETNLYRVVFFGKKDEIQLIRTHYPALIPYIPLSITIFEEPTQTGISAIDPVSLYQLYKSDDIKQLVESWHNDIVAIFSEYQHCAT